LDVAMQLYDRFSKEYQQCDLTGKIGIITPYKAQLYELRNRFRSRYGEAITNIIEFNTTDAFQGRECEIIIFSCVRASSTGGIGFMTDIRRMNVGLTRAKSSLWILGDSRALVQGEFWRKLIEDAQARDRYTKGDILNMFRRPLEKAKPGAYLPPPPQTGAGSSVPQKAQDSDLVMRDAPSRTSSLPSSRSNSPIVTAAQQPPPAPLIPGLGGIERTEVVPRSGGPPVIHTSSAGKPQGETKKRSHDGPEPHQPVTKRVCQPTPPKVVRTPDQSNTRTDSERQSTRRRAPRQVWSKTTSTTQASNRPLGYVSHGIDASRTAASDGANWSFDTNRPQDTNGAEDSDGTLESDDDIEWIDVLPGTGRQ
jgi:senataxin